MDREERVGFGGKRLFFFLYFGFGYGGRMRGLVYGYFFISNFKFYFINIIKEF